jgi:putative ABC transport system substrate-binding protein
MNRREFITLAGATASPMLFARAAPAQDRPAMLRLGSTSLRPVRGTFFEVVQQRLHELGYVEGKNLTLDYINLENRADGYGEAMRELVRRKVDVIVAFGPEIALKAAMAATGTIPIVMIAIDYDPFARGYIKSLSRPTGNVTGVYLQQIALATKRIQLLRDALPNLRGATVFWDQISTDQWHATEKAAAQFGLQVTGVKLSDLPYDYERALTQVPPEHRGLLIPMTSPLFARDRERLPQFARRHNMASMFVFREYVDHGGLMSYGPKRSAMARRGADYVNRIARGAKPSELPIEQPTVFELVVNLKTAKALGIKLSQAILLRADDVIE